MEFKALENERWVTAKTFKGEYPNYLVSDMGRCWNCKTKQFVGSWVDGYWKVNLTKSRKQREHLMIGRLMLISFGIPIPKHLQGLPTNKIDTMHLDGDSYNNNLSNFAWGSRKENQNEINARIRQSEALKGKRHTEEAKRKMSEAKKGEKHPMYGKYGKDSPTSKPILQLSKDGEFIRCWDCTMDAHRELGINQSHISACAKGKRPSAGGYIWRYK